LPAPKNIWFKKLVLWQCERVMFPNMRQPYNEIIPNMVSKSIESRVIPTFIEATTITITFYLWMSWKGFDMFVLVVNYYIKKWIPCQITIGILEVHKTSRTTMGLELKDLFTHFDLCDKVIACINNESTNLNTLANALTSIMSCVTLMLAQPYASSCYGHAMSKCY
jgi:hypothetical protein